MPTMPLNQLASFSASGWRFEWRKITARASTAFEKPPPPFRPGIRPRTEFSDNENSISTICLAEILFYCQRSSAATAPHSVDFWAIRQAAPKIIEEHSGPAAPSSFVLQLPDGLCTVPGNDSPSLQHCAARSACCCLFCCRLSSFVLQHPKCALRTLRCFTNGPSLVTRRWL